MSQYSIEKDEFLNTNKSIYECFMLAVASTGTNDVFDTVIRWREAR